MTLKEIKESILHRISVLRAAQSDIRREEKEMQSNIDQLEWVAGMMDEKIQNQATPHDT